LTRDHQIKIFILKKMKKMGGGFGHPLGFDAQGGGRNHRQTTIGGVVSATPLGPWGWLPKPPLGVVSTTPLAQIFSFFFFLEKSMFIWFFFLNKKKLGSHVSTSNWSTCQFVRLTNGKINLITFQTLRRKK
jgi:hypothetical protein